MVAPLRGGHREDDRLDPVDLPLVHLHVLDLSSDARDHAQQAGHALSLGHLAHLPQLAEEVLEREVGLAQLGLHLARLVLVELVLGALDQRHHVAHAEDPRGHAVGVELLQLVELLSD